MSLKITAPSSEAFARRLRGRRDALGLRKPELAAAVGVSLTTIQQYENGQFPKGELAVRLAAALDCSLDWLLAGRGSPHGRPATRTADARGTDADAAVATVRDMADVADVADTRLVMVPMVEARLSAGTGSFETGGEVLRHYAFRWDFLRRKGNPASMALLRVAGDSMQPLILNNDVVLIDQSQNEPVPGRIYAVGVEDMVYLKIVNAMPGRIILSSVNESYAPIEARTDEQLADLVRIIGKAVWVGRELE